VGLRGCFAGRFGTLQELYKCAIYIEVNLGHACNFKYAARFSSETWQACDRFLASTWVANLPLNWHCARETAATSQGHKAVFPVYNNKQQTTTNNQQQPTSVKQQQCTTMHKPKSAAAEVLAWPDTWYTHLVVNRQTDESNKQPKKQTSTPTQGRVQGNNLPSLHHVKGEPRQEKHVSWGEDCLKNPRFACQRLGHPLGHLTGDAELRLPGVGVG
jgi:hypothetical protein